MTIRSLCLGLALPAFSLFVSNAVAQDPGAQAAQMAADAANQMAFQQSQLAAQQTAQMQMDAANASATLAMQQAMANSNSATEVSRSIRDFEANVDPNKIRTHVQFLSDDLFEGRYPGQRGGELAAKYIATQFAVYGLKPAGDNGT